LLKKEIARRRDEHKVADCGRGRLRHPMRANEKLAFHTPSKSNFLALKPNIRSEYNRPNVLFQILKYIPLTIHSFSYTIVVDMKKIYRTKVYLLQNIVYLECFIVHLLG
jgi:hypothetical protein